MNLPRILLFCCLLFALYATSCREGKPNDDGGEKMATKYAEGFEVTLYDGYTVAELRDPWDTTRLLHRYVLVDKKAELPTGLPDGTLVRTPVGRIIVYSSVHGSMLDALGAAHGIVGVCESQYIANATLRARIAGRRIVDVGNSFAPDVEKIIALAPDAIFTSPFENCG